MQTILLLDSCTLTRECLTTILRAKGYRVQSSALVSQAKTMIAKRPPDLIITEIRLPDDNILNLMRSLKDDPNAAKTKVCPAHASRLQEAHHGRDRAWCMQSPCSNQSSPSQDSLNPSMRLAWRSRAPAATTSAQGEAAPSVAQARYPLPMPVQDPALALKDIKPIIARTTLKEKLDEMEELRTIGAPISHILQAIDSPDTKIEDVADLLKMDQIIANEDHEGCQLNRIRPRRNKPPHSKMP